MLLSYWSLRKKTLLVRPERTDHQMQPDVKDANMRRKDISELMSCRVTWV